MVAIDLCVFSQSLEEHIAEIHAMKGLTAVSFL